MGIYIDKGNNAFREIRNSEYVDKSGLIAVVNKTLRTEQKFSCVTRSRRFGKSMAAKMLADVTEVEGLEVAEMHGVEQHQYRHHLAVGKAAWTVATPLA